MLSRGRTLCGMALAGSVWTSNVQRAMRVSGALEFGTVWVNDHLPLTGGDAARRLQAERLRQRYVALRARRLHPDQARDARHDRRPAQRAGTTPSLATPNKDRTSPPTLSLIAGRGLLAFGLISSQCGDERGQIVAIGRPTDALPERREILAQRILPLLLRGAKILQKLIVRVLVAQMCKLRHGEDAVL